MNNVPEGFTLNTYLPLACITKAKVESKELDTLHGGMGLLTEVGELYDAYKRHIFYRKDLDMINLKEEIGDILWYLAISLDARGETQFPSFQTHISETLPEKVGDTFPGSIFLLGKILVYTSQITINETIRNTEEAEEGFMYACSNLLSFLYALASLNSFTLEEAAYLNVVKLSKRYPEGFTEFHALNRDTTRELDHITA